MLVIHNAKIYTQDRHQPFATAVAINNGHILAVGSDDIILDSHPNAGQLNAESRAIIPGLTDAHIHLADYAFSLQKVDCETETRQECIKRVVERVQQSAPGEWILGHGWNQNRWPDGSGTAHLLDEVAPHHPVYLTHKSLHSAWANSAALHLAGIDRNTPDPPGGYIGRLENGEPDGILIESATDLVENIIPEPGLDQLISAFKSIQSVLWRMGLTGVHDFNGIHCFTALQVLHQAADLKLRVTKGIPGDNLPAAIALGLRSGFGDDMLRIGPVKLFSDGALGTQTAAMFAAYENDPQNCGLLLLNTEELVELGQQAVLNGINLAVHAIGDRANHIVLDGFAKLREIEQSLLVKSKPLLRHRIEHVQIIHPDDAIRFKNLQIIASMQPIHATSDMVMADRHWGKRSRQAYAWHELLSHGTSLAFGSDAPVESPNPFWGIHAAVTRRRADGSPSVEGWYPEQRISVGEAIRAYTYGSALAGVQETQLGKLAPGFLADLVILNKDPYTCLPDELLDIHPLATMVEGEWVFSILE